MSNNTLVQLIYGALKSQNNEKRELAEQQIIDILQSNPNKFFLECASLLVNQKENNFIRQSASTLLVSSIREKCNSVYYWDILEPNTRQSVKNQMLNTLVDPNSMIMKSGANVISHIAAIQIPRNQWLDLVDNLAQNTGHQDVNVRKASIITIGNICQQFHKLAFKIQPRACQQFLGGIIMGIQEKYDASIIQQYMKALRNILSFLKRILSLQNYINQADRQYYVKTITKVFEYLLFNLLNSKTQIVALNTLNGLVTISQFFPFLFYNYPNVTAIINKFFQLINPQKPNLTTAVLKILKNITQNLEPNCVFLTQPNILLTNIVNWYERFLDNFKGSSKDFAQKSNLLIMNCLVKLQNRQIILFIIEFVEKKYYFFYYHQVSDQLIRLSSLASIVHACILALKNMILQERLINNLCNLIDKHLNLFGIQQWGLKMISAMAITFNKAFQPRTEKYWKYLEGGLELISQPRTFYAALCLVDRFRQVYAKKFITQELHILDRFLILIHEGFDREIKLDILKFIEYLLLDLDQFAAEPYLKRIIQMIDIFFQAVYQHSNNPNQRQYVKKLKSSLINMYASLTFCINGKPDRKKSQLLFDHFPSLTKFVVHTCQKSQNPTIDYIKICLYLIFDSATFYWISQYHRKTLKDILQSQQVINLVEILQIFNQRDDIRQLQELIQQKYECM